MRWLRYWIGTVFLLASTLSLLANLASAEGNCEYVLGFQILHDLIPDIVGRCIVDVHYDAVNGDGLQNSEKGLLVWRKADNFTAFTDGHRTWVNGPYGIQERLNTERFDWENDGSQANAQAPVSSATAPVLVAAQAPTSTSSCSLGKDTVTFDQFTADYNGASYGQGTVRNSCDEPVNLAIDVYANAAGTGLPVIDAPTLSVSNLAPHMSKAIGVRVPAKLPGVNFTWQFVRVGPSRWCLDGDSLHCAWVDPSLSSAYAALINVDEGKPLVSAAESNGIRVQRGDTPSNILGYYQLSSKTVIIDRQLDAYSSWVRAAILGHELRHAADFTSGSMPPKGLECYKAEERAFRTEAAIWSRFWKGQLPSNIDSVHTELNEIVQALGRDPEGFGIAMSIQYGQECGE